MGAWGSGVFEDDTSLDLLDEFEDIEDPEEFMRESFEIALEADYLEYDDGISAWVSAALMDAAMNHPEDYIELYEAYPYILNMIKDIDFTYLKPLAIKALRVLMSEKSELNELWEDSDDYEEWTTGIIKLIGNLK